MKLHKSYIVVGLIIAFGLMFELAAHADESDQATQITFSAPIQIPGQVLPAGSYLFKVLNPETEQNVVQIFNSDGTHLYATLETIAAERQDPTGHTEVVLAEQGSNKPDALVQWFYPGRLIGNEFVYSQQTEKEIAQDTRQTIIANQQTMSNSRGVGAGE